MHYLVDGSFAKQCIRRAQAQADLRRRFQLRFQLLAELLHVCSTHGCMHSFWQCINRLFRHACLRLSNYEGCFHLHKLHSHSVRVVGPRVRRMLVFQEPMCVCTACTPLLPRHRSFVRCLAGQLVTIRWTAYLRSTTCKRDNKLHGL